MCVSVFLLCVCVYVCVCALSNVYQLFFFFVSFFFFFNDNSLLLLCFLLCHLYFFYMYRLLSALSSGFLVFIFMFPLIVSQTFSFLSCTYHFLPCAFSLIDFITVYFLHSINLYFPLSFFTPCIFFSFPILSSLIWSFFAFSPSSFPLISLPSFPLSSFSCLPFLSI